MSDLGKIGLHVTLLLTLFAPMASAAEKRCPAWTDEARPIITKTHRYYSKWAEEFRDQGLEFSTNSYFWTKGVWFEIPLGYRNPWLHQPYADVVADKAKYINWLSQSTYKGYDPKTGAYDKDLIIKGGIDGIFAFWMPSGRYLERDRWISPNLRPCEAGRPRPTSDDYVVHFTIDWPFLPGYLESFPGNRFRVAIDALQKGKKLTGQGWSRAEHSLDVPISGTKPYYIYSDDTALTVMFSCSKYRGDDLSPNPLCHGSILSKPDKLILYLRFPADKGQSGRAELWRAPVMAAIQMAKDWKKNE